MIKTLKSWFSKRAKEPVQDIEEDQTVAFFNLALDADQNLILTSDFIDGHEDAMSQLVFLLCSGTLMELVGSIVEKRCGDDIEKRDLILSEAYKLIMENITTAGAEEDDDDPVVDPCNVFNPKMHDETSEELD